MLGPIFNREALTVPRRSQHYVSRAAYLGLLWILGLFVAVLSLTGATPASAQPDRTGAPGAQPDGGGHGRPCRNGYVGLTFDDGPSPTTPRLLSALRSYHLRATMFNQGNHAEQYPQYVRAEVRARMWIGNHTFTHPHLPQLGEPGIFMEIASTQWVLRDLTGQTGSTTLRFIRTREASRRRMKLLERTPASRTRRGRRDARIRTVPPSDTGEASRARRA